VTSVREISVAIEDLAETVKAQMSLGFGIGCMYVTEQSDLIKRSLEMIMASNDDVLRITAPLSDDAYAALTPEFPSANVYEREIWEMSNVFPIGHHDMRPLKIRNVREGIYPMQKAADTSKVSYRVHIPGNDVIGKGVFEIPVGPIHAGVIEPGHFRFSVAGEPILMLRTYMGYKYRGIEKMMETPVVKDNTRLMERVSGDNAIAHSLAYLQAMERDTEIPVRAQYVRTIYAELERIYYMLNGISGIALDTALSVPASKGYMLKERILRLNHKVSGHRMLWGTLRPGGLRKDLTDESAKEIEKEVVRLKFDVDELFDIMTSSPSFMDRVESTGTVTKDEAVLMRAVGPIARASGIDYDVRKHHPYAAYGMIGMRTSTHTSGDVFARLYVKKKEISESVSIITQCINNMGRGDILTKVKMPEGFSMGMTESPRGEIMHCMHVVNGEIWRYKIRDASFPNWPVIELAVVGDIVPDFPLINKSFDLSYSGNDL